MIHKDKDICIDRVIDKFAPQGNRKLDFVLQSVFSIMSIVC